MRTAIVAVQSAQGLSIHSQARDVLCSGSVYSE